MSLRRLLPSLLSLCLLAACGGGGVSIGGPTATESFYSLDAYDGYVARWNAGLDKSATTNSSIRVGDGGDDKSFRGFVRFNLASLPAGVTIVKAELTIEQTGVWTNPYGMLGGQIHVDHVDIGTSLNGADFFAAALSPSPGVLSASPDLGEKGLEVTAAVLHALGSPGSTCDFRFRFDTLSNGDIFTDAAIFNDGGNHGSTGYVPRLKIEYLP